MESAYVIGLDQSTQGTKAVLLDEKGSILEKAFMEHKQIISPGGWVSHDGEEIYTNCLRVIEDLLRKAQVPAEKIRALGISNQRETTIAWDRETGESAAPAIVWQCARAKEITDGFRDPVFLEKVRYATGIPLSPYFPAAKAAWLLRHSLQVRELAEKGRLCLGTMDSFLVFKMTGGKIFRTDFSNASRTQLFNLHTLTWDKELCRAFGIPGEALPEVEYSDGDFGATDLEGLLPFPVPIRGVMGDSHAALFGQGCTEPGMAKVTYGTGSSIMMNIGDRFKESMNGLATSLAWGRGGRVSYVLEGNINYAGAVITWMQKDLGLFENARETSSMAREANSADRTCLVPAFSGLGAPYWRDGACAILSGMSRTTGRKEIVKAGLCSIAFQVTDIVKAMSGDALLPLSELRADGGPTANDFLMQFQSDIACVKLKVREAPELSAMGAAFMAGIEQGVYKEEILREDRHIKTYFPAMTDREREEKYRNWKQAVEKA